MTEAKSVDELRIELAIVKALKTDRVENRTLFADKTVQTVVYWIIGLVAGGLLVGATKLLFDALVRMVVK